MPINCNATTNIKCEWPTQIDADIDAYLPCPKSQRICVAYRIAIDICINTSPRHEFIVREGIFPRRFSG